MVKKRGMGTVNINAIVASMVDRADAVLAFDWVSHEEGLTREVYEFNHPGFNPPQDFIARSLHCAYGTMDPDDRERFKEIYTLEFSIMDKVFYGAPLSAIPERGVLFPIQPCDEPVQPGTLTVARYLGPQMPFAIRLFGTPVEVERLRFLPFLKGLMDRGCV